VDRQCRCSPEPASLGRKYHDLVGYPDFAANDTSSVTKLGFAGAAMPDGLLQRVDAALAWRTAMRRRPATIVDVDDNVDWPPHRKGMPALPFTVRMRSESR
jgi:hypothetical protein